VPFEGGPLVRPDAKAAMKRIMSLLRHALVPVLLLGAAPIPAQQRGGQDIVVTGEREKARKEAVRALTRSVSAESEGQVARLSEPVCADSIGFDAPYGQMVVDRIVRAAREAGVAVDKPGCRPNLTVMMVESGQRELQALYKARPGLFGFVPPAERKRLLADEGPVHVVTLTETRDRDGETPHWTAANMAGGGTTTRQLEVHSVSIINPSTRQDIGGSLVLIDRGAAIGKTLRQLSDYAAMRLLARTREAEPSDSTILTLFAPGASPPPELTGFDRAYLKALYQGPATRAYLNQVGSIAQSINRTGAAAKTQDPVPQQ
jgi:hypothetical protein